MSGLCFILLLLIFISIPTLIYTIFYILKCPPNTFLISSPRHPPLPRATLAVESSGKAAGVDRTELVTVVVVVAASESEEAREDCPVCLSAFDDGEELWQLKLCKHVFHAPCIEKWLHARSSCPVCRAYVVSHKAPAPHKLSLVVPAAREADLWQGLPDSEGLV